MSDPNFSDNKFSIYFVAMIIAMIVLTALLMVFASINAREVNDAKYAESQQSKMDSIVKQIAPVGKLAIGAVASVVPEANADETAVNAVYQGGCAGCHSSGAAGAPIVGDKDAWVPRLAKGVDALYASAINGIGIMPARGGQSISDDQVKEAVDYMIKASK
jgi:cytochrome c5